MRREHHKIKKKNYRIFYRNGYRTIEPVHSIWFWLSLPFMVGLGVGMLLGVYIG